MENDKIINSALTEEITNIIKELRQGYYKTIENESRDYPDIPNGGDVKDSTNNTPAIYLEGPHCCKSDVGCCTNCFYSMYKQHGQQKIKEKMKSQVDWILENFDEEVVQKQDGPSDIKKDKFNYPDKEPIVVTISPTGSYFSDHEFPKKVRMYMLKKLLEKSEEYERDVVLITEAHSTDVINGIDEEEAELLRKLHNKCILGFESAVEYSRNILYNKKLPIDTYEKAVEVLQSNGIDVGSFVIGGLITYTDEETKKDMLESVRYLKSKGVFPVMMFSNIQEYTMPDVLYKGGKYHLLQPFTTTDITYEMLKILGEDSYWMVPEPVSGPPVPKNNIFYNRQDTTTSPYLNRELHKLLFKLRMTRDSEHFIKSYEDLLQKHPEEYQKYREHLETESKQSGTLRDRLVDAITYTKKNLSEYLLGVTQGDTDGEERDSTDITIKTETLKEIKGEGR